MAPVFNKEGFRGTTTVVKDALSAVAAVRNASRKHAEARSRLKALQKNLDESRSTLEYRDRINSNFNTIIHEQTAHKESALSDSKAAQRALDELSSQKTQLETQLDTLKKEHEESLRPYKSLMEATKGRSDDAARSLAELKRAIKQADQQLSDVVKRREQRIASANRVVDSARERLSRVQAELQALQRDSSSDASAVAKTQREAIAEQAHLDAARDELKRTTAECQQMVDNAQTHLWTQRQSLETVERQAEEAKHEAELNRKEYEERFNAAQAQEKALHDDIARHTQAISSSEKELSAAQVTIQEAEALLAEANDIHSTPELTEELRQKVQALELEQAVVEQEVAEAEHHERHVRSTTRTQRLIFMLVCAVVLVALIVGTLFLTGVL